MEINKFSKIEGVVTQENMVEGRFVLLTANAFQGTVINVDNDLPGVKLPANAAEASVARYCVTWAVDNRDAPIVNYPFTLWDTRRGWGGNTPAGPLTGVTMYLTHPGNQESLTMPSGQKALAFTDATVTLPSGQYVDSADIRVPGAAIVIANTADDGAADAGKPKYTASGVNAIAFTREYHNGNLTVIIK